ncbi:glucokinase [Legionella worsleiensis]|uniref:glucokinase n=1 Tax=Legionella worsleiensis TaxID=45076 RepID=UPI0039E7D2AC
MNVDDLNTYAIVADIGGTFARFGRVNLVTLQMDKIEIYSCASFPTPESVFIAYQKQHALCHLKRAAIAIACPVLDDFISMTNGHWQFSIAEFKKNVQLTELKVMNDFTAIAQSLSYLAAHEQMQIGAGFQDVNKVRVVLGAGTGLGVAYLVPHHSVYIAYAGEGGHADWGATSEQEWFIYTYLKNHYSHVSLERLISGHGLENLYNALAAYHRQDKAPLKAADIISLALNKSCPVAQATVEQFFICLGRYAGDLALTYGAFGGVYLAGGIVPRLLSLLKHSHFRTCFEDKGRFSAFNALIPTYVITAEQPGILGAAASLRYSIQGEYDVVS